MFKGKTYNELQIGESAYMSKTVSESDIYLFAGITGDFNPMHVNEEYAKKTKFKTRIAHGGLTVGLIAPVLGLMLPGEGTIVSSLSVNFLAPVKIGDTITSKVEVAEKNEEKKNVKMLLEWINQQNTKVASGEAVVYPPK